MKNSETKDFIAYEYLSINVKSEKEPLYIDCYENFGWILVNNAILVDKEDYYINSYDKLVNIKFKRDRRIKNKKELLSLQRKLEIALKKIDKLEYEPESLGVIIAMVIGVIGIISLVISILIFTKEESIYIIGILTGIIGILGIILPFFGYRKVKIKKEQENEPLIEKQYDVIYEVCKEARNLID